MMRRQGLRNLMDTHMDEFLCRKRCVISVTDTKKDTNCGSAVIVAIYKRKKDAKSRYLVKHQDRNKGVEMKRLLLNAVGAHMIGREPKLIEDYQEIFKGTYQFVVWMIQSYNDVKIVFSGDEPAQHQIYLLQTVDGLYRVLTSPKALFNYDFFCTKCFGFEDKSMRHRCRLICDKCNGKGQHVGEIYQHCISCLQSFYNEACMAEHINNGTCVTQNYCTRCEQIYSTVTMHKCNMGWCATCQITHPPGRHYVKVCSKSPKPRTQFLFFDFETYTNADQLVTPIMVVASIYRKGPTLPPQTITFTGPDCADKLLDFILQKRNRGLCCFAHNSKGFDSFFLLRPLYNRNLKISMISNGQKIMVIDIGSGYRIRFIDSLNYIAAPLRKIPSMFEITDAAKSFFPHAFVNADTLDYVGPIPDRSFYEPDKMSVTDRLEFDTFYEQQLVEYNDDNHWNLKQVMEKYCRADVWVLAKCVLKFRDMFMSITSIDPFAYDVTIAGACLRVFMTHYLKPGQMAVVPAQGYSPTTGSSMVALKWLAWLETTTAGDIQTILTPGGEYKIPPNFRVDGYDPVNKKVYDFHGIILFLRFQCVVDLYLHLIIL